AGWPTDMDPSAFDQLLRLGDELQTDYGHIFDAESELNSFDERIDRDTHLSLLLSDYGAPPCSTSSSSVSYSGMASQSSSSSPTASHNSATSCFPYQDMLHDGSPVLLQQSPQSMEGGGMQQMRQPEMTTMMEMGMNGGGEEMMIDYSHYEEYASPSGTYSSSDDSGHHSPVTSIDQPIFDLEAGCYDYGNVQLQHVQQHELLHRSSSEDSCEYVAETAPPPAAPAARRVLRMQQGPPTAQPQQQQKPRVVYVLPPQQQQRAAVAAPAAKPAVYKASPAPRIVQVRQPQQHVQQQHQVVRPMRPATVVAAAPTTVYQPIRVQPDVVRPSTAPMATVLLARAAPCVQLVTSNGTLLTQLKVEPTEEITEEEDKQYFRKQEDRKQKNRAAAQQSRLRRRCELDELRTTVGELSDRNRELEEENGRLKRRVRELESQLHWSPPRKRVAVAGAAATTLMVFVMMFAFQTTPLDRSLSPFALSVPVSRQIVGGDTTHSRVVRDVSAEVAPKSRALLAIEDYEETEAKKESEEMARFQEELEKKNNVTATREKGGEGCGGTGTKRYPNQTETIRLNTELNNWVESHDLVEWASGLQGGRRMFTLSGLGAKRRLVTEKKGNGTVSSFNSTLTRLHSIGNGTRMEEEKGEVKKAKKKSPRGEAKREAAKERAMRDRAWKHLDMVSPGLREHGPENRQEWSGRGEKIEKKTNRRLVGGVEEKEREWRESYERLAAAVQQRTDTLYVVAMKDYFLLPAIERNATFRPRVSLILPAVMNGTMTTANNQIMLMRLDLDVVGTGMLHVAEGLLPIFQHLSIN
ncbi:hypothetical protein PFISCL1PPCAC_25085, partial [Pristionchus fissidentatus]